MSIAFNAIGIILLVSRSFAVLLSVCIDAGGWGWPSSSSVWRIEMVVFAMIKRALSSASVADDTTAHIICEILMTAPFFVGLLSLPTMNMCPPTRLHAVGLDE